MYEPKMKENAASVIAFIEKLEQPRKREDAHRLLEIFEETTGYKAKIKCHGNKAAESLNKLRFSTGSSSAQEVRMICAWHDRS